MAFADLVDSDGKMLWWGLEVCTAGDDFATVQYRWATAAGDVGGVHFQERLATIGNIHRSLGADHLPVASTVEIIIDNTDFAADFLVNRATVESQGFKTRFRLHVGIDDGTPNTYQATIVTQQVGVFVCLDFPARNGSSVKLSLTDDSLGKLSDLLASPTLADWRQDAGNTADNALFDLAPWGNELAALTDFETPIPLQFGVPPYIGVPVSFWNTQPTLADFDLANWPAGERRYLFPIVVCATRDTATIDAADVTGLRAKFQGTFGVPLPGALPTSAGAVPFSQNLAGTTVVIPQTFAGITYGSTLYTRIWKAYKTQTITKDGFAWKLLWIAFDAFVFEQWFVQTHGVYPPQRYNDFSIDSRANTFAAFESFEINGHPGSGVLGQAADTYTNPANIMFDLVESYSAMGAGAIDATRFTRARNAIRMDAKGNISFEGIEGGQSKSVVGEREIVSYGSGQLRKAIAELAKSCDVDVFMTMAGKVGIAVMAADFETQTLTYPTIDEARIGGVVDTVPSQGERWSPYNRVFLKCADGRTRGPYDDAAAIATWGKTIQKVLECKWWWSNIVRSFAGGSSAKDLPAVKNFRFIEAKVRPIISFTTDVGILVLELADYFLLSWTRGGESTAYASTLWRLESVAISPNSGSVDVTAVWMGDLQTDHPFILDNEALLLRSSPTFGQTLTATTGSTTLVRSAGSFITDTVAAGDIVRMRDTAEAATAFARNRDIKVVSVTDATHIVVADSVFGAAGAHVIADTDWTIVKSFLTYPNLASDPTNYPSGSLMYGKISNSVGQFSDATPANKLLDG